MKFGRGYISLIYIMQSQICYNQYKMFWMKQEMYSIELQENG